jgi:hypothetical protein
MNNLNLNSLLEIAGKTFELGERLLANNIADNIILKHKSGWMVRDLPACLNRFVQQKNFFCLALVLELHLKDGGQVKEQDVITVKQYLFSEGEFERGDKLYAIFCVKCGDYKKISDCFYDALSRLNVTAAAECLNALQNKEHVIEFLVAKFCFLVATAKLDDALKLFVEKQLLSGLIQKAHPFSYLMILLCRVRKEDRRSHLGNIKARLLSNSETNVVQISEFIKMLWLADEQPELRDITRDLVKLIKADTAIRSAVLRQPIFVRQLIFTLQRLNWFEDEEYVLNQQTAISPVEVKSVRIKRDLLKDPYSPILRSNLTPGREKGIRTVAVKNRYLEFPLLIYGDVYVEEFKSFLFKSLMSAKDIVGICDQYDVHFVITTLHKYVDNISEAFDSCNIPLSFSFDLETLENEEEANSFRALFFLRALRRVEEKNGILVTLCADAVVGTGLSSLINNCPEGGGAGGNLIRASSGHMRRSLVTGELDYILSSSCRNEMLSHKAVTSWRHHFQNVYFNNFTSDFATTKVEDQTITAGFLGVPFVIKPRNNLAYCFVSKSKIRYGNDFLEHVVQYIDHEFPSYLGNQDKLYVPKNFHEFCFVELSKTSGYSSIWKALWPIHNFNCIPRAEVFNI